MTPSATNAWKILLIGKGGQIGGELSSLLRPFGELIVCGEEDLDLTQENRIPGKLREVRPHVIVNAAAYTAVDKAEEEPDLALAVNGTAPTILAEEAKKLGAALVHYSTDYVFDGAATEPYKESGLPSPLSIYGESKLAGERAIEASGCQHLIVRTSWVYSAHGSNFVLSMLKLAKRRLPLSIVDDQTGCPTWARNLARASVLLIQSGMEPSSVGNGNIYHYCDSDVVSWHDFAQLVFSTAVELNLLDESPSLKRVTSGEYPQLAARPNYSVLDTRAVRRAGIEPASLAESVYECMKELVRE